MLFNRDPAQLEAMASRARGLYEVLLTEALAAELAELDERLEVRKDALRSAEAADRIALHLGRIIQRVVADVGDEDRVAVGVSLARKLLAQIDPPRSFPDARNELPIEPGTVLRAIVGRQPDGTAEPIAEPLIPLLDTALLTTHRASRGSVIRS